MGKGLTSPIRLHPRTRDLLAAIKTGDQTYDDVVLDLLESREALAYSKAHGSYLEPTKEAQTAYVYMMRQLIDDWLPTSEHNIGFRQRFYDMFNLVAPDYLGDLVRDKWWDQWLNDTYEEAKAILKDGVSIE